MYFVRKLSKLRIDTRIVNLFYSAIIQSALSFSITCWYGSCSIEAKGKLTRIIRNCVKLGVENSSNLADIYKKSSLHRCEVITSDPSHPLNSSYQLLPSGKRLRSMNCRTSRYCKSFVPDSIRALNKR